MKDLKQLYILNITLGIISEFHKLYLCINFHLSINSYINTFQQLSLKLELFTQKIAYKN